MDHHGAVIHQHQLVFQNVVMCFFSADNFSPINLNSDNLIGVCMVAGIESYGAVKNELKFFATSSVRVKLLISLNEEEMSVDQLRSEFGYRTSTILPVIAELKSKDLIYQDNRCYGVTPIGKLVSLKLIDFIRTLELLKTQKLFWLNHESHNIPELFFASIGSLNNSCIVDDTSANPFATHENFVSLLEGCSVIKGVSPILYPDYPEIFKQLIEGGIEVRLVVTDQVLELMHAKYDKILKDMIGKSNFNLRLTHEKMRTAFTVTDKFLSLGLYRTDGKYDFGTDLVSEDPAAIEWGNALFEYYWHRSVDVTPPDWD